MTILKKNYSHLDKASKNCKKLFKIYYSQLWSHSWVVVITIIAASSVTSMIVLTVILAYHEEYYALECIFGLWPVISSFQWQAIDSENTSVDTSAPVGLAGGCFSFFATWGCEVVSWPVGYDFLYTCVYIYTYTCVVDCSFCSLCAKIENPSYIIIYIYCVLSYWIHVH